MQSRHKVRMKKTRDSYAKLTKKNEAGFHWGGAERKIELENERRTGAQSQVVFTIAWKVLQGGKKPKKGSEPKRQRVNTEDRELQKKGRSRTRTNV